MGIALAIAIAFAGGWLAANFHAAANPPRFEILEDFRAEIPLVKFESFDGKILRGTFEGMQPRFLVGEREEIVVPKEGKFEVSLEMLK
ncbi:hypothetical protein KKF38_02595 [Patescibacteria group bacterium]|nr:hypothetical protein [Patescibacteria group bacterium]